MAKLVAKILPLEAEEHMEIQELLPEPMLSCTRAQGLEGLGVGKSWGEILSMLEFVYVTGLDHLGGEWLESVTQYTLHCDPNTSNTCAS